MKDSQQHQNTKPHSGGGGGGIARVALSLCVICSVAALGLVRLSMTAAPIRAFRSEQQQHPIPAAAASRTNIPTYDFRSRAYTDERVELDYRVEWLGDVDGGDGAATWVLPVNTPASLRVTLNPNNAASASPSNDSSSKTTPAPLTCQKGATHAERIHIVLEGPAVLSPRAVIEDGDDDDDNDGTTTRSTTTTTKTTTSASVFEVVAYEPGIYNVHVESIEGCGLGNNRNTTIHRVRGSPFQLRVQGKQAEFPRRRCPDYRYRHGRWLECQSTPLACTRTGWVWVPDECYSHVYTPEEILNQERPTWIVLAGSSVERGSFFSLVDHVLGRRAANVSDSDFWKCWGWMDLTVGNFRVSYLDFRWVGVLANTSMSAVEPNYFQRAMLALMQIGSQNDGQGPDVFHVEVPTDPNTSLPIQEYLSMMRGALGINWRGRLVVSVRKIWSAVYPIAGNKSPDARFAKPKLYEWMEAHPDQQAFEPSDETSLAAPTIHETRHVAKAEKLPPLRWSQHYHRQCKQGDMHVCSPVCDAAAQQLLNIAYTNGGGGGGGGDAAGGPASGLGLAAAAATALGRLGMGGGSVDGQRTGGTWGDYGDDGQGGNTQTNRNPSSSQQPPPMQFCLRCPPQLVPFTVIIPEAHTLVCHAFLPASRDGRKMRRRRRE